MSAYLSDVIDKALPGEVDAMLARILGTSLAPGWDDGRHRAEVWGCFGGHLTADILALAGNTRFQGALVIAEAEAERIFYMHGGSVLGSTSNVLFERLGRVLYQADVVTHEDSEKLIEVEEQEGGAALLDWLPTGVLFWAVARRVECVAATLPYIRGGHFVLVAGEPQLQGLPTLSLDPYLVGDEACRLYDVWRHGGADGEDAADGDAAPGASHASSAPDPLPGPLSARRSKEEEVDDLLRRIREADLGFK